jgi:hypothetical protein
MKRAVVAIQFALTLMVAALSCYAQSSNQDTSTATLSETFNWLIDNVHWQGGDARDNVKSYWTWNMRKYYDSLTQSSPCVLAITGSNESYIQKSFDGEQDYPEEWHTTWHVTWPIYYLKSAYASGTDIILEFDGAKVDYDETGNRTVRWGNDQGTKSINVNTSYSRWTLNVNRQKQGDNAEMARRLANAFTHAANLCSSSRPKSTEPF